MPGMSLKLSGLDDEPPGPAQADSGLPWVRTPGSTRVGESDAEETECNGVFADPMSIAVGRSSEVTSSTGKPLPGIFSPEDDRPLSSGRGGFLGAIECCGSDCRISAMPSGDLSLNGGNVSVRRVRQYTTTLLIR